MTAANGLWGLLLTGSFPLPPSGAASAYTPGTPSPTPLPTLPPPTPTPAASGAAEAAGFALEGWMIAAGAAALALIIALAVFFIVRARRRRAPAAYAGGVTLSVGKVHETGARESQQDCFAVLPEELWPEHGLLAVVADGMGGLADGDRVSQCAVSAFFDCFCNVQGEPQLVLLELLRRANNAVNALLGPGGASRSGSTLVAALVRDGCLSFVSVGDSRIALLRDGALYTLDREHVYRNELLCAAVNGERSFESALSHPRAGGLTSYLGMGRLKYVDFPAAPIALMPGDRVVLMSDGVYNALGVSELADALLLPPEQAAEEIRRAVSAKGYSTQDNYTAVVIGLERGTRA